VTLQEVIGHFQALKQDAARSESLDVLLNVSEAEVLPDSSQLMSVKAELGAIREQVQFGICAIVAGRDAMFGMMRVFEVYAGAYFHAIRVFRESDDAEAWLASQRAALDAGHKPSPRRAPKP
jgi:hypothetical protein